MLHAAQVAQEEDLPDYAEDCILRAATLAPLEVEQLAAPVPEPLRSVLRRLLQRKPEDRYPSAAKLEAELRAGLAALGAPYGAAQALEELQASSDEGSMNRTVAAPRSESKPPAAVPLNGKSPPKPGRDR